MRNPERIEIIAKRIAELWLKYPDLRLGQMIESIRKYYLGNRDLFYIEDYDLLRALEARFDDGKNVEVPELFLPGPNLVEQCEIVMKELKKKGSILEESK